VIASEEPPANLVVVAPDLAECPDSIESRQRHDRQKAAEADAQGKTRAQQQPI
jgi:hypothetical protein